MSTKSCYRFRRSVCNLRFMDRDTIVSDKLKQAVSITLILAGLS
ncbi:hypothetical protein LEP1GSC109_0693 [Leptospira interrogans str. UI 13372]|nr:hypothetical protein LEP1GSC109_0693 [Leptospira interrogans str. UI 13372]